MRTGLYTLLSRYSKFQPFFLAGIIIFGFHIRNFFETATYPETLQEITSIVKLLIAQYK